jgi:hypothetical protein
MRKAAVKPHRTNGRGCLQAPRGHRTGCGPKIYLKAYATMTQASAGTIVAWFPTPRQAHREEHLELAKQGCDKMVIDVPREHESRRFMDVARRTDIRLAEKDHRLTVERLEDRTRP